MKRTPLTLALFSLLLWASPSRAEEVELRVGDPAPSFEAVADDGSVWKSADVVGKEFLVVYFYPAAMTFGCTKQACNYRDNRSKLQALGATVVGVSGDRPEGLKAFKGANRLNFPLLSDPKGEVAKKFGVPVSEGDTITREIDGKEIELTRDVTAKRWTFIIDKAGNIAYKDTWVNPLGDGANVVEAIEKLTRSTKTKE